VYFFLYLLFTRVNNKKSALSRINFVKNIFFIFRVGVVNRITSRCNQPPSVLLVGPRAVRCCILLLLFMQGIPLHQPPQKTYWSLGTSTSFDLTRYCFRSISFDFCLELHCARYQTLRNWIPAHSFTSSSGEVFRLTSGMITSFSSPNYSKNRLSDDIVD